MNLFLPPSKERFLSKMKECAPLGRAVFRVWPSLGIFIFEQAHDKTYKMFIGKSSLCAQWVAEDPSFLRTDSKD